VATEESELDQIDYPAKPGAAEEGAESHESNAPVTEPATDDVTDAADDAEAVDGDTDASEADVTYENGRPLVQELQYQAPKGKAASTAEDEESVEVKFSSVAEAKAVVEGFLFSCNEPLSVSKISKLMGNLHPKTVRGLLLELQWEYENRPGGLQVVEIAGGYQMSTRAFVAPWMFRMHKHKRRSALSPATLETLAIIAYRQPITKGEIEAIRGVESGAPLRTLQELNLVEASGRREVIGRPQLYITTEQFLKTFGLKSVGDLPSISELKTRYTEEQKLKPVMAAAPAKTEEDLQETTPGDADPDDANTVDSAKSGEIADSDYDEDDVIVEDSLDTEEDTERQSDQTPDDNSDDDVSDSDVTEEAPEEWEDSEED
jgi:segregation and condensation protein B